MKIKSFEVLKNLKPLVRKVGVLLLLAGIILGPKLSTAESQQPEGLPPDFFKKLAATHRTSDLTLRQVMQEMMSDLQSIIVGISMDNLEQVAESAQRLGKHKMPKGGLRPYLPVDKHDQLSVLPAMETIISDEVKSIVEATKEGNTATAALHITPLIQGCVTCHSIFRGTPGAVSLPAETIKK